MAALGVILFTKPAYMLMNKLKVGFYVLILDIFNETLNIVAIVFLIIINGILFGMDSMTTINKLC